MIESNTWLFSVLGATFGGDGQQTFALPNLRAVTAKNCIYCIAVTPDIGEPYEPIIGETVQLPASNTQGAGQLVPCDGRLYSATQYPTLFTYLGNRFGDSGQTTSLPNLTANVVATNYQYRIAVQGSLPNSLEGRNPLIGELILLPYSDRYPGLQQCDGSQLIIDENRALFSATYKCDF